MLEFIVLGRIPGTYIELGFTDVLLGTAFLTLTYWSVRHFSAKNNGEKREHFSLEHAL